jgi:hypothetical protein
LPLSHVSISATEDEDAFTSIATLTERVNIFLINNNIFLPNPELIPEIVVQNISEKINCTLGEEMATNTVNAESMAALALGQREYDIIFNLSLEPPYQIYKIWHGLLQGNFGTAQFLIYYDIAATEQIRGK